MSVSLTINSDHGNDTTCGEARGSSLGLRPNLEDCIAHDIAQVPGRRVDFSQGGDVWVSVHVQRTSEMTETLQCQTRFS